MAKKKLKKVNNKDYKLIWNSNSSSCKIKHKNGSVFEPGSGVSDAISVYYFDGKILILSINYPAQYACIEIFDNGLDEAIFAEKKDIKDQSLLVTVGVVPSF